METERPTELNVNDEIIAYIESLDDREFIKVYKLLYMFLQEEHLKRFNILTQGSLDRLDVK